MMEFYIADHRKYIKYFTEQVRTLLTEKFSNLAIIFYDQSKKERLDGDDRNEITKLVNINEKYFESLIYYSFQDKKNVGRSKSFYNLLEKT